MTSKSFVTKGDLCIFEQIANQVLYKHFRGVGVWGHAYFTYLGGEIQNWENPAYIILARSLNQITSWYQHYLVLLILPSATYIANISQYYQMLPNTTKNYQYYLNIVQYFHLILDITNTNQLTLSNIAKKYPK